MKVANLRGAASLVDSTCQYPRVFVGIGEFLIHATKKKCKIQTLDGCSHILRINVMYLSGTSV